MDSSSCRRKLKSVGEEIDDNLIKIIAVYPYWQHLSVVLVGKLYVLGFCLLAEQREDIAHKGYQLCLAHMHLHLSFVNLSKVHHLVDKS